MNEHFDKGSLIVIVITFVLFTLALFTKGFTHDLLLEAGVFLVPVKLLIIAQLAHFLKLPFVLHLWVEFT